MGQKTGEKWTAEAVSQPTISKSDRLLGQQGLAADALVPALPEALHGRVPSCRNLFDGTDAQGRLLRYCIEGPIKVALAQL